MSYTKRKLLDRVLAMVLTVMMVIAALPMSVYAIGDTDYATVTTYTGGEVKNNGTANVKVVVEETTLQWVESNDQKDEGWWVGIKVEAPEGFSENATYKSKSNPSQDYGSAKNFEDFKDGDNYIGLWFPVSTESLIKFANEGRNLTLMYAFDWNGDAVYEQEITFSVVPSEKIVLIKNGEQVYPVPTYTVSVTKSEGGSILLDNAESDSKTVETGTAVQITAKADEGYKIASLSIDGQIDEKAAGKTEYSTSTEVSKDIEVNVTFVKVWTVTVTYSGNGQVEMTPSGDGGSVTVEAGTNVVIKATPDQHYNVSKVTINGEEDKSFTSKNNADYETTLQADKEYTIKILFAPNVYNITANEAENGSVRAESSSVEYNESTKVYLTPDKGYTVDTITVNGSPVTSVVKDATGIYFEINNIAEDQSVVVSFKKTAAADEADLNIDDDSDLRPDADTLIVLKNGSSIVFATDKAGIRAYNNDGLVGGDETTQFVTVDSTLTITKVELYYQADDELYADWHTVEMDELSIVVDKGENVTASLTTNPAANENGYHNSNVTFEVSAEDNGDYSGLSLVEYWITYNGADSSKITLYEYKDGEEIKNTFADSEKLVVDATLYNSDDIKVTLHVVDRAGNEKTVEKTLKINSTKPTVSLDITGTQFENAQDGYYNAKRELTITIVDRKDTFSAKNVAAGLQIKKNGEVITVDPSDISWTDTDSLHIGKYTFEDDGHYEWSMTYTNDAGLSNDGVTAPSDKNIYDFYIDTAAPYNLKVTYEPEFKDVFLEAITFGFYKAPVTVTIEAVDDTAKIAQFEYKYTGVDGTTISGVDVKRDGTRAYATFTIPPEFRGKVSFSATDKAGRTSEEYEDDRVVVIDTIAPGVTVEWESEDEAVANGKYFKSSRTAIIKIKEDNFFADDIKDGLLLLMQTKVLNDGTRSETNLTPEFTKEGDVYVATVTFNEDADYTFDIKYTDRSGNVYDDYPMDEFTIDTIKPVIKVSYDNNTAINGDQFEDARKATITVTEHNFAENRIEALVNEAPYSLEWMPVEGVADTYEATVPFPGDSHYIFSVNGVDLANNGNDGLDSGGSVAPWEFTVDGSGPDNLKISYEPTFVGTMLEGLTFGFYKAPVKVTIEATDNISGVDYFTYSYIVQEGASEINIGAKDVKVDVDGTTASATFEIPAQFRGFVSFIATSNAGVSSSYADSNVVIVDDIAPGITVEYTNNNALNGSYFKDNRTATIKIEEANYFAADIEDGLLVITRTTVLNDGTTTEEMLSPEFTKEGDVYTATVDFDQNADYTLNVTYTDRAGNENDGVDYKESTSPVEFTVDKIQPVISIEKANGAYFNTDRTAKITVVEHNFRASDFQFTAEAYNVIGKDDANKIDLSSKAYQAYLQNQANWTLVAADTWEAEITFDIEGNYTIGATYTDLAGNEQIAPISDTFCVDKSDPKDLKVSYEPSFIGTLLETITFGFYKAPVTVTIEAKDDIAGVDHFVYSYTVEDGASATNEGKSNVTVAATSETGTNRSYATFEIPAQFRGNVSFTAYDNATNHNFYADENVVIVDNVAPGVKVDYNNHNDFYKNFFKADRTATIEINEANFFGTQKWNYADIEDDFLVITVGKTLNDGTYTSTKMKPEFSKNGDVYTAAIHFDEDADYTFDIKYTDRSGNVYDSYEMDKFTVDKIKPVINVSYNDEAKYENGDQFRTNRTATITITEHNFNAADVVAKVMASGTEVKSYAEYLKNAENWKHYTSAGVEVQNAADGDIHVAEIKYTEEAHYTFEIGYTDMAGNANDGVDYGTSVAPTAFTVDKSAPTDLDIRINNVSVAGSMETLAFNKFYDATVSVKLSANCDISGLQSLKYQKVANASEYDENGIWIDYNSKTGIVVSPSEKFIIYCRAEDRAGNVAIIRSTGIVVDNQKPVGETNAPEIDILPAATNANGIHKSNVNVDLKVVDPKYSGAEATANGYYSGLSKITYKIYTTDTTAVQEGTLFDIAGSTAGAIFDADKLAKSWTGRITIDSTKFNSNNVIVEVTATDNAGNTRTTTTKAGDIKIDITVPTIDVYYDNNDADSGSYFKTNRTATIVVTERNFNPADVKAIITNTDGVIPALSSWTKTNGTGNADDTRWTATIYYSADGDYTFDIAYTDLAGNACSGAQYGNSVVPTAFTIDKTLPTISVVYDNNSAENTNYYKAERTATITITEHNFNAERVVTTITATDDGAATTVPTVSGWTTNGNVHTAKIRYARDALYSFDIAFTDMAGNVAADFAQQTFYVDKTNPSLEITGVANNSANNGDVIPVVTYSDTNYDSSKVTITLTGANRGPVDLDGFYTDINNGRTFTFNNFADEKDIDDIYTLTATLTDKAGNTTEQTITFSVNRFGSNYTVSDSTKDLNGTYVKGPQDVVITETNANALKDITITLFKNNETITLVDGEDYRIDVVGGNGEWYQYTYTIFAKNFEDDGVYRISIHSKDAAGNVAENTLDTKGTEISFGVDKTNPTLVVTNLESGKTYALENLTVIMSANDNLLLNSVVVYLDNDSTPYKTWNAEEIAEILAGNDEFIFDVSGDSTSAHYVRVVCTDAAGNETSEEFTDFFVTTNLWVRYYNNKPLFFGSIGGVILLAAMVVFLIVWKRRKKEEQ